MRWLLFLFACGVPPSATRGDVAETAVALSAALEHTLTRLGYTERETWHASTAGVGPDVEGGIAIVVRVNPRTHAAIVLHEDPEARAFWNQYVAPYVRYAGRFSWDDQARGVIIVRPGAEPHHVLEEHFHHHFSRAEIRRFRDRAYLTKDEAPRVADTETYAAVMAYRFIVADPALGAPWIWNGHADLGAAYAGVTSRELLDLTLARGANLERICKGSVNTGDGRPNRPTRDRERMQEPELDEVGISRSSAPGMLSWETVRALDIPWTADDEAWLTSNDPQDGE